MGEGTPLGWRRRGRSLVSVRWGASARHDVVGLNRPALVVLSLGLRFDDGWVVDVDADADDVVVVALVEEI